MMKNIFCIGGATVDRKFKSLDGLKPGTSNPVSSIATYGGVARNVAENLAHWTDQIYLQTVIGNDQEGKQLLEHIKKLGVNTDDCLTLPHCQTAHYYAALNEDGELFIAFADMDIFAEIPPVFTAQWQNWPEKSIIFIDTNLSEILIETAIKQIPAKKLMLCIDPVSLSKAKKIPPLLEQVFLIKPNQMEASLLTGIPIHSMHDCITAGFRLLDRGVENVVISLNKSGYVIINAKEQTHFESMRVDEVKDVNGAGDAFIAGILFGLQLDSSLSYACQLGAAAAAFTVQTTKTVSEKIKASQLYEFIANHTIQEPKYASIF